jgi:predicted nucleic acid-binding protein
MIVVADTSPINYLVLIDHIGLLPRLNVLPLRAPSATEKYRCAQLDPGESEAIALAGELGVGVVWIDASRQVDRRRHAEGSKWPVPFRS